MGTPRITWLLVGLVVVSMFAGVIGIYISKMSNAYGVTPENNTLELYNKLDSLHNNTQNVKNSMSDLSEETGVLDVIGNLFSNGYNVLMSVPKSIDLLFSMINQGLIDSNLGEGGEIIKTAITLIILILVFIGVILTVVLKANGTI